jgi:hypothetical protein
MSEFTKPGLEHKLAYTFAELTRAGLGSEPHLSGMERLGLLRTVKLGRRKVVTAEEVRRLLTEGAQSPTKRMQNNHKE